MTARVPRVAPTPAVLAAHYVGRPYYAALAQGHVDMAAHLLGAQLGDVCHVAFGSSTATNDTFRLAYQAGPNVRAVAVMLVPRGSTGSNPSVAVANAETETPIAVNWTSASVTDLGDLPVPHLYQFVVPVTAGALQELSWTVANVLLHSAHVYEIPRAELLTTNSHVDRTFADAGRYLTDDVGASNPRGFPALLNAMRSARSSMRRHVINLPFRPGVASAGSSGGTYDYLLGSATHGFETTCRSVGEDPMPVRVKVRISALAAGSVHTIRLYPHAYGDPTDITGVNATGWWPGGAIGTAGEAGYLNLSDTVDVQATHTSGSAGTVTIDSVCVYEDV